jgi:Tfp pilus assembly protein PilX
MHPRPPNHLPTCDFRRRRSGLALVLVVAVLATAAVLAYAMLSANTLQAEISSNLTHAAGAEYVAESGVNVGMYYLQTPASAPPSWTSSAGYKLYASAVPLNDGTQSNFDLSVTANPTPNTYTLQSTGWPSTGSAFSHTATAIVTVNRAPIPGAGVFGGNITIPSRTTFSSNGVTGALAVQADGTITQSGGTISGAQSVAPLEGNAYIVPTASTVNFYGVGTTGGNYLWTDNTTLGTPQQITTSTLTAANLPATLSTNPAGIFYHQGNLSITSNITIAGTLIVRGGTLTLQNTVTINPKAQFPALICEDNAILKGSSHVLTANGVVFLGTGFSWTGSNTNSSFVVNGALLMPAGASIGTSTKGTVDVAYSRSNTNVPLLTTFDQPGISVQIDSWTQ